MKLKTSAIIISSFFMALLMTGVSFAETGFAAWYGPNFHGKTTSSGEKFDMYAMTAAHKTYPFGTKILVTDLKSNKTVIVRVNDRCYKSDRILDLSYAAAKELGILSKGQAYVRVMIIGKDSPTTTSSSTPELQILKGPFTVQVGSFPDPEEARKYAHKVRQLIWYSFQNHVFVRTSRAESVTMYVVNVGKFDDRKQAEHMALSLINKGLSATVRPLQ